jgi:hypothetical protein
LTVGDLLRFRPRAIASEYAEDPEVNRLVDRLQARLARRRAHGTERETPEPEPEVVRLARELRALRAKLRAEGALKPRGPERGA